MTNKSTQPPNQPDNLGKKRYVLIRNMLLSLLLLTIILFSTVAWLLSTEAGLRFLVNQAQQWMPGELTVKTLQGRLLDDFGFSDLSYRHQGTVVQVSSFQLAWEAKDLLTARVHVKQLQINNVAVQLPQAAEKQAQKNNTPLELPNLKLPVQIALDDVQIKHVSIKNADSAPLLIDTIVFRSTTTDTLSLQQLQVQSPLFTAKLAGTLGLQNPHSVQLQLDWSVHLPNALTVAGQGEVSGNMQKLIITHTVSKPLEIRLTSTLKDLLGALQFDAEMNWQALYWPLVGETKLVNSSPGHLTLSGSLEKYHLALTTNLSGQQIPRGPWHITAQGNQQELIVEKLRTELLQGVVEATGKVSWQPQLAVQLHLGTHHLRLKDFWQEWPEALMLDSQLVATLEGDNFNLKQLDLTLPPTTAKVSLHGEGFLVKQQPQLKIAALTWQNVQWPLLGNQPVANSTEGRLHFSGSVQDYHFDLYSHVAGQQIPVGQWNISGQGNLQQVALERLRTDILNGVITGQGGVSWQPKLAAQLNLRADKLTLETLWNEWPKDLQLNSQVVAKLEGDNFTIDQVEVSLPATAAKLSLQGRGSLADKHNPSFKTILAWQGVQWPLVGNNAILNSPMGRVNLVGTVQDYQINLDTHLVGKQVPRQHLTVTGQGNLQQFTLSSLRTDLLKGVVTATGQVRWQPNLVAQLQFDADKLMLQELWSEWPEGLRVNSRLVANLAGPNFKVTQLEVTLPQTSTKLTLQGEGTLAGNSPRFKTTITWQGLRWPLIPSEKETVLVSSSNGKLSAAGTSQAYQLQLDTDLQGNDIPKGHWQVVGQGDSRSLQLNSLKGEVLQGVLNLSGKIRWQPSINWELVLQGNNLNPGKQWPDWPGKIALDIHSQGQVQNGAVDTQVEVKQVQGQLRNYPLKLQTTLGVNGSHYDIKGLDFQSGTARLRVNGNLGQDSDLNWDINIPDLATLLPAGKGSLTGIGKVRGSLDLPHLTAQLKGSALHFQDKQVQTVQADMDVNLQTGNDSQLQIIATEFKQGQTQIERLQLQGQGNVANHTLVAKVTMPPHDQVALQLQGSFKQPRWQGQLQQFTVAVAKMGSAWELQTPVAITLSPTEAQLARLCLKNADSAKGCTQLHWQKTATSSVQANLENLPLSLLQAFLPPNAAITGNLAGTLAATLRPEGTVTSDAVFHVSPGVLKMLVNEEAEEFVHHGGNLTWQLNQNGLVANIDLKLLKQSGIVGKVALPQFAPTLTLPQRERGENGPEQPLQGQLHATFDDLSILPTFVPQAEKTQGQVKLDVVLGGTLAAPQVQGQLQVENVATDLPDLGLQLKNFNMTVKDNGRNTLQMQAQMSSGQGTLNLQGEAQLLSLTDWNAQLKMAGNNFEVVNMPMAWALASPNIDVRLSPSGIAVTGQLAIPQAAITPPETTSGTVSVSKDVVIIHPIHPQPTAESQAGGLPISSNLTILLGEKVTFKGAGFKSRLSGTLRASNTPGKVTIGNGEVLIDGVYKAYGQDLTVAGGRVIFTGGPIDNPGLDIRAFRRIYQRGSREETSIRSDEEVIAGVHIHGTAKSPELTLYSQPALDQSNTLSYIVLGKPASQASGEEGKALLGAALASQFQGSGDSLTQKITNQFGLDEASLSSKGGVTDTELVVGKYLSPELYISYGVGLFDARTILRIRYQLTKRLTLETETGTQSGVDLRYSFER